jgi:hypothetical protein
MRKPKLDPILSTRRLGFASQPESELSARSRAIRIAQGGATTSKRKPGMPAMPWDKEPEDDKA